MSNEVKQTFERRINSLIEQINFLNKQDDYDEIISNLSKYLCILIAGYTEKMFVYYLNKYFENKAHPKLVPPVIGAKIAPTKIIPHPIPIFVRNDFQL